MCMFSATAENQRDARVGEDLVVSRAPHGVSKWLTAPGVPDCAVCNPDTAILAIQVPGGTVRGASFRNLEKPVDGNFDFLEYLDGGKERVALNNMPLGTNVRVLSLAAARNIPAPPIPAVIGKRTAAQEPEMEPAAVGEIRGLGGNRSTRRNPLTRLFDY
jgi:hypothetical protein